MKVVVSYGCDLEDIPSTITELLQNLKENHIPLVEIDVHDAILNTNDGNITEALDTLDQARQKLAKMDNRLMDYMSILAGYSKTSADVHLGIDPTIPTSVTQEVSATDVLEAKEENVNSEEETAQND